MKTVRENLKIIMKMSFSSFFMIILRFSLTVFIKDTITKIISNLNENINMMVEIIVNEKTK